MSYNTVEAALLAVIQLIAGSVYTASNSSQGDYRILASGKDRLVVLQPGLILAREVSAAPRYIRTRWRVKIELYIPFAGELSTIASNIRSIRQQLIDQVDKYPTLNGTSGIVLAFITGGGEPQVWTGEVQRFWYQELDCDIEERATVAIAE